MQCQKTGIRRFCTMRVFSENFFAGLTRLQGSPMEVK